MQQTRPDTSASGWLEVDGCNEGEEQAATQHLEYPVVENDLFGFAAVAAVDVHGVAQYGQSEGH
jgi:hypothetical protein